ncbi:hypothetical protein [Ascidiimonas aurantiaca]|uniref:hypothetical protein n=1 Tax=Ascidiimonas aurantiaca TaxID=1685432 RepID=UPI0030EE899E
MKKFKKVLVLTMTILFACNTIAAQDNEQIDADTITTITATYDGFITGSYSFLFLNDDGEEESIFFDYASDSVLEMFDLQSKKFEGKKFEVTYKETIVVEEDEDGEEIEYTKTTIISLKPVQ